jgi:hypothetical protein
MHILFKHAGLQVLPVDIKAFYEDILSFKIERSFALSAEESSNIFGIDSPVEIIQGCCGQVNLELFISDNLCQPTYNHTCISVSNAESIVKLALQKGYRVHARNGKSAATYFLSDSNRNIFEVNNI